MNNQEQLKPNRPTHHAYIVKERPADKKSRWIEVGAAWVHKDGKGFSLKLDAVPTTCDRIEIRMIDWKKADERGADPEPIPAEEY
jgi:hypothetical protein